MSAHNISSGRSCRGAGSDIFLECIDCPFGGSVDSEYFVCFDNTENCRRLTLTIHSALVQGAQVGICVCVSERERQNMKRILTWAAAALMAVAATLSAASSAPPETRPGPAAASGCTLTVLNPQGPVKKGRDLAPRLKTLEGKKIALWLSSTSDQLYAGRGAELYDLLAKMLEEKFAGIRIVPYADLPMKYAPQHEVVEAITAARPDAVVAAFGG